MIEPYCLAFVLCDGVHQDPQTRKFTLNGIFHGFRSGSFPTVIRLCAYFALTDGQGSTTIAIQIVNAEMGIAPDAPLEPIFRIEQEATFESKLDVLEGVIQVQVPIPSAGTYLVELYSRSTPLMARRLVVTGPGPNV